MPARQGSANETGSDTRFGPAGFSSGADPGLPAALPLWLSEGRSGSQIAGAMKLDVTGHS
jgi:hypothetical protein